MEELHYMYDIPIAPPPVPRHRGRARAEEDEFDAVDHNVEELPPMMQTQTQSQTGYASPMMMQPAFGSGYYDSEAGPSSSYMHTHGHDVHEAPAEVPEQPDPPEQPRVQSRRRQPARNRRRPPCGTH